MNDDLQTYIEPELEARLVALVLGEASAFEAGELERLMTERVELRACMKRLEGVHGVMVSAHETGDDDRWKLSEARRGKIFAKVEAARLEREREEAQRQSRANARALRRRKLVMACAACVVMGMMVTVLMELGDVKESRSVDLLGGSSHVMETEMLTRNAAPTASKDENGRMILALDAESNKQIDIYGEESKPKDEAASGNPFLRNAKGRVATLESALAELDEAVPGSLSLQGVENSESTGALPTKFFRANDARSRDSIKPKSRVAIPGIPSSPRGNVNEVVTGGNRSGVAAIDRAVVDGLLNGRLGGESGTEKKSKLADALAELDEAVPDVSVVDGVASLYALSFEDGNEADPLPQVNTAGVNLGFDDKPEPFEGVAKEKAKRGRALSESDALAEKPRQVRVTTKDVEREDGRLGWAGKDKDSRWSERNEKVPEPASEPAAKMPPTMKRVSKAEVASKPSAPMPRVVATNTNSPGAIPVPEIEVAEALTDFGNGDDFGDGFGNGRGSGGGKEEDRSKSGYAFWFNPGNHKTNAGVVDSRRSVKLDPTSGKGMQRMREKQEAEGKVPELGDLPVLGRLVDEQGDLEEDPSGGEGQVRGVAYRGKKKWKGQDAKRRPANKEIGRYYSDESDRFFADGNEGGKTNLPESTSELRALKVSGNRETTNRVIRRETPDAPALGFELADQSIENGQPLGDDDSSLYGQDYVDAKILEGKELATNFHRLTAQSHSVLENVRDGGLKTNLSGFQHSAEVNRGVEFAELDQLAGDLLPADEEIVWHRTQKSGDVEKKGEELKAVSEGIAGGSLESREEIRRQGGVSRSDEIRNEGIQAYAKGDYETATLKYREALVDLPFGTATEDRREYLNKVLQDSSIALTQNYRRTGRYEEARELLEEVEANDPGNAEVAKSLKYLEDPIRSSPSLGDEHTKAVDKVSRNLYRGEGYYDLGLYDKAEEEFKEVLRTDPYNKAARRWMERTGTIKSSYYQAAYDQTRAEMLMEVDKAWELEVPPADSDGDGMSDAEGFLFERTGGATVLNSKNKEGDDLADITQKIWKVEPGFTDWLKQSGAGSVEGESDVTALLKKTGVEMPPNSSASYLADGTLIVRSTRTQLELVDGIVAGFEKDLKKKEAAQKEAETRRMERENFETSTTQKSDSTFSLNVSDVSFKLAKSSLASGKRPEVAKVRAEEFVNAFDYGDTKPTQAEKVSCVFEQGSHPFMSQRNLMRISMSTASLGRNAETPLRLTLLLDQSGSMERLDRVESLKRAFALLAAQLNANDEVTLVGFARTPRLLAERVKGNEVAKLAEIIANPLTEGGTNLEGALSTALQLAKQQYVKGAQNRIILMTDGAANLGDARPETLARQVESMRKAGISFDACGVGADGLNDEVLSSLAKKGDGRYYFLDRPEDADEGFAKQIAGALRPAAKNVKVQVLFNPERVATFKLYGFEKHKLKKEDFRNDAVDAAEMAAEESGMALYHFEPKPEGRGDVGTVSVRFLDAASNEMVERTWVIPYEKETPFFNEADAKLRLAGVAGLFAERLKGSPVGDRVELKKLRQELQVLRAEFGSQTRFQELQTMLQQAGN